MKIINPLYDKAFKYLMENNRLAKKVLGVILETKIEELILSQQETVVPDEKRFFTLFRLDFKAIIRKPDGSRETILIELQKSKYDTDIQRFRNYLGANYISKIDDKDETQTSENYPIVTIYILGYNLPDLPYLAVTVNNQIVNSINKEPLELESFFVSMLTHRSHILQVRRLPEERKTRLEKFMLLFNQAWHADKKYILDLQEIPKGFKDIVEYLQRPVLDEEFRRQLEAEEEIDTIFDRQESKYLQKIAEAEAEAERERKKKEQARQREEQERKEKEQALQRENQTRKQLITSAKEMKKVGIPDEKIAEITNLPVKEIKKL